MSDMRTLGRWGRAGGRGWRWFSVFTVIVLTTSCAVYEYEEEPVYLDPSVGRVVLYNDSKNFVVQDSDIF